MLWNRPSDAWLNIRELKAAERKAVFAALEQNVELKRIDLMKQYLSSVKYERIESMVVLSGTAIGNEPEDTEVTVKRVPGYRYATLRITDPMVDPFERIGTGWRFLVSWLEDHDFKEPDFKFNSNANCLEEVKMVDCMLLEELEAFLKKNTYLSFYDRF